MPKGRKFGMEGSSYFVNEDVNPSFSPMNKIRDTAERFKAFMAKTFCNCLSTVPSFALVILAAVLLMLLVATIPLAFAFTYMNPEPRISELPKVSEKVIRADSVIFVKPEGLIKNTLTIFNAKSILPPQIDTCQGFGFSCTNEPSQVVGTNKRCDGYSDCQDGSDEQDCQECQTVLHCMGHEKSRVCLRGTYLCDGIEQCKNGYDENQFCRSNCTNSELKCKGPTGLDICLPDHMICDGDQHCASGEDEIDCKRCNNGAKFCAAQNTCIPKFKICDAKFDCSDGSDELDCNCMSCSGNDKALCDGTSKKCIGKKSVCDGVNDCPNGEDEFGCPGTCTLPNISGYNGTDKGHILCEDGRFHPWKYACGAAYEECKGKCLQCNIESAFDCHANLEAEQRPLYKTCINRAMVCDGKPDCPNDSDEMQCNCKETKHMLMCSESSKCFHHKQKCDGVHDCQNGSDEKDCMQCLNGAFYCAADKECISSLKRCDGISDCSDESDELGCSCEECKIHPFEIYVCASGNRCFRKNTVCNPLSQCPDPTQVDQMYCAINAGGGKAYI